jgi:hypothetical protein
MLFMFNMDWARFDIGQQVEEGNKYLTEMTKVLGVLERIIFNCASMGAGEWVLGSKKGSQDVPQDTLNYLRWHHHKVLESIRSSNQFQANRDFSEMLQTLRANGHVLAAVATTKTDNIDVALKKTRTHDWFDGHVYGYDRRPDRLLGNVTLSALFATAVDALDTDYEESLVVADNPEAIIDACPLQTRAIVGYIDPYIEEMEMDRRHKEMVDAGAHFMAVGGHTVTALPYFISGQAEQVTRAQLKKIRNMGQDFH